MWLSFSGQLAFEKVKGGLPQHPPQQCEAHSRSFGSHLPRKCRLRWFRPMTRELISNHEIVMVHSTVQWWTVQRRNTTELGFPISWNPANRLPAIYPPTQARSRKSPHSYPCLVMLLHIRSTTKPYLITFLLYSGSWGLVDKVRLVGSCT